MKTISVGLEWGSYPLQELDNNGFIVDDISAEELGMDSEFCDKIQKLQNMYDDLFVNNEKEFSYIGNEKPEEVKKIKNIYLDLVDEFLGKPNNKFNFKILDLDIQMENSL